MVVTSWVNWCIGSVSEALMSSLHLYVLRTRLIMKLYNSAFVSIDRSLSELSSLPPSPWFPFPPQPPLPQIISLLLFFFSLALQPLTSVALLQSSSSPHLLFWHLPFTPSSSYFYFPYIFLHILYFSDFLPLFHLLLNFTSSLLLPHSLIKLQLSQTKSILGELVFHQVASPLVFCPTCL